VNAVVVGGGSWGTAFARLLASRGHDVTLAARDPERHAILLDFTILSSILHGAVMTYDSFAQEHEMLHLVGDVPILFALAGVLIWLHPRRWPTAEAVTGSSV